MTSPILDTFKDRKYDAFAVTILIGYGVMLLFFDELLFFSPFFTFYVPASGIGILVLDLVLTALTTLVLTVSARQIFLQRASRGSSRIGALGIIAAVVAGACPCYYLIPLLAVAGTIGGVVGAMGILLYAFEIPVKFAAALLLASVAYKLEKSGVCKVTLSN